MLRRGIPWVPPGKLTSYISGPDLSLGENFIYLLPDLLGIFPKKKSKNQNFMNFFKPLIIKEIKHP